MIEITNSISECTSRLDMTAGSVNWVINQILEPCSAVILANQQERVKGLVRDGEEGERKKRKRNSNFHPQRNTRKVSLGRISYSECPEFTEMPQNQ